ncbi:hypothetical protein TNCT_102821 [Trichonephila clavata]|uniref:Uncharacterized protein n=1 Tax=Trichonephila clavata TaxID=2740835 RepID=A0A8X6GDV3_TRICU|nr:hypothetical protein TNCT_102821 [Trichonephila clavata]
MKLRLSSSASSRFRGMKLWLISICIACFGKIAVSSPVVKDEIQHIHPSHNLVTENKDSNKTKYSSEPATNEIDIKSSDVLDRNSRALPRFDDFEIPENVEEDNLFQHVQKLPSEVNAVYVIPHLRPGRSSNEISPLLGYNLYTHDAYDHADKRNRETMIPMLRFGRSSSLVPIPRFGKSLKYGDRTFDFSDDNDGVNDVKEIMQLSKKNNDAMIPMPRFGKSESLIPVPRFGRSNSLIPGPRFGRSDSLIPIPRFGKRSDSLIPIPRFGRSDSLIPIPRFGRSFGNVKIAEGLVLENDNIENRLYENNRDLEGNTFGEEVITFTGEDNNDDIVEQDEDFEAYSSEIKRNIDDSGTIIPYPRFGRMLETKSEKIKENLDSADMDVKRLTNESLIPQIRYGRNSGNVKTLENEQPNIFILPNIRPGRSSKPVNENKDEKTKSIQYGLLPYPRPGRSNTDNLGNQHDKRVNEFVSDTLDVLKRFNVNGADTSDMNIEKIRASFETLILDPNYPKHHESDKDLEKQVMKSEQDESLFVIPYPRPGKRNEQFSKSPVGTSNAISFPHLFKVKFDEKRNSDFVLPYPRLGKRSNEEFSKSKAEMEYKESNIEKPNGSYNDILSNFHTNIQKRSVEPEKETFILPYPRLGRSNSILPYPRLGRSNSVLPYPRPGRSNSVLPYPRPGRSNSVLPYPRPGRSDSILPYPRLGRSNVMLPYPRPGRSLNIVPYPRLGRSTSIVPYPRPGRSNLMIPFPRPGRSDLMLPYPRLGRSDLILPYPRPGRSMSDLSYQRFGRSDTIVPIPRPGRSKEDESNLLPYSRMEKTFQMQNSLLKGDGMLKRGFEERLIPFMQTEDISNNENEFFGVGVYIDGDKTGTKSSNIQNNPSPSKKLNKNIPTGESIYMVPYPRPGRSI